jgi:hypothetical protein
MRTRNEECRSRRGAEAGRGGGAHGRGAPRPMTTRHVGYRVTTRTASSIIARVAPPYARRCRAHARLDGVESLRRRICTDLWSCCGRAVVVLWSCCGRAVVVLWSCCGRAVVVLVLVLCSCRCACSCSCRCGARARARARLTLPYGVAHTYSARPHDDRAARLARPYGRAQRQDGPCPPSRLAQHRHPSDHSSFRVRIPCSQLLVDVRHPPIVVARP